MRPPVVRYSRSGGFFRYSGSPQALELFNHSLVRNGVDWQQFTFYLDYARLKAAIFYPHLYARILRQLLGVEIYVPEQRSTAELGIQLPVDGFGDLFQRPAWSSASGARIKIARAVNIYLRCIRKHLNLPPIDLLAFDTVHFIRLSCLIP